MANSHLISIHLSTPDTYGDPVCIAGTFNHWNEHEYLMRKVQEGRYQLEFELPMNTPQPVEYKFIRSRWANVELDEFGGSTPNRCIEDPDEPIQAWVPRWRNEGKICDETLQPIIQHHYRRLPRSRKDRRISVLLPYDYFQSDKKYPVLYLLDGQNLYEEGAPFGSWEIHKKLAVLAEKNQHEVIIVAIDHAGIKRIEEYNYIRHYKGEQGRGHQFVNWVAEDLKPFIDSNYRTLADQNNTGIGGSSMGGLISLMAGTTLPNVFGKLMLFSPSLWKIIDVLYDPLMYLPLVSHDQYIYLYAGSKEASNMAGFASDFYQQLLSIDNGNDRLHFSLKEEGHHAEKYWGNEFPYALKYLFF